MMTGGRPVVLMKWLSNADRRLGQARTDKSHDAPRPTTHRARPRHAPRPLTYTRHCGRSWHTSHGRAEAGGRSTPVRSTPQTPTHTHTGARPETPRAPEMIHSVSRRTHEAAQHTLRRPSAAYVLYEVSQGAGALGCRCPGLASWFAFSPSHAPRPAWPRAGEPPRVTPAPWPYTGRARSARGSPPTEVYTL